LGFGRGISESKSTLVAVVDLRAPLRTGRKAIAAEEKAARLAERLRELGLTQICAFCAGYRQVELPTRVALPIAASRCDEAS